MADRPTPIGERPVLAGLLALTAVAVVVGLLAGVTVLTGTKILGIGGGDGTASGGGATSGETLVLPEFEETEGPDGPLITLNVDPIPSPDGSTADDDDDAEEKKSAAERRKERRKKEKEEAAAEGITLNAGQSSVSAMERIDLTGSYPTGSGAILKVQRFENGAWADFPVTVSVSNGTFATYVMTGQSGQTRFRVLDTDSGKTSNPVTVSIG